MLPGEFPVELRSFARARLKAPDTLRIKGLKFRGKWAVVFSAEDLSTGLVGQQVDGINGFTPACATELMRRLVLNLSPATGPAAPSEGGTPAATPTNPATPEGTPAPEVGRRRQAGER
jgi:hypothetical protein